MSAAAPTELPISPVPSLPTLGLSVEEELAALRQAVVNLRTLITNFNAGGVTETYLEAISITLGNDASTVTNGVLMGLYEALNNVQNAAFILTASGAALDNKAADVGVYRKPAAVANESQAIAFTAQTPPLQTRIIPAGVILAAPNADPTLPPTLYQTTTPATVNVGSNISTFADVTCLSAGAVGNVAPGTINQIISGTSGYTATNVIAIGGGADTESDESLRQRALNAIPAASQSTVFALQQAALTYPGIESAVVYDLTSPPPDLVHITLGMAQIFCDDGTGTLGAFTATAAPFTVPNVGLTFTVTVADLDAFGVGSNVSISGPNAGGTTTSLTVAITAVDATNGYTCQVTTISEGAVGDQVLSGAAVISPQSGALAQFNADLNAGKWKAAGAEVHAWGSTQVAITVHMEVYLSENYLTIASEAEILATVQQALFDAVNALPIGRPVVLSMLIDTAMDVLGVAEVPLSSVLINGVNSDYGVSNGVLSMSPSVTVRVRSLSDVTVVNRMTVEYG